MDTTNIPLTGLTNKVERIGLMKNVKCFITATVTAVSLMGTVHSASAGGLFGDGGLIRGSVGKFLDKNLEKPITTPLARGATVAAGTAAGTYVGGLVGAPQIGGAIGGQLGHVTNNVAAGRKPFQSGQQTTTGGYSGNQQVQVQPNYRAYNQYQPVFSNRCFTNIGIAQIYPQQIGTGCQALHRNGYWYAGVVR